MTVTIVHCEVGKCTYVEQSVKIDHKEYHVSTECSFVVRFIFMSHKFIIKCLLILPRLSPSSLSPPLVFKTIFLLTSALLFIFNPHLFFSLIPLPSPYDPLLRLLAIPRSPSSFTYLSSFTLLLYLISLLFSYAFTCPVPSFVNSPFIFPCPRTVS